MAAVSLTSIAAAAAGTTAAAAYLDAKYHLSSDIRLILLGARARKTYDQLVKVKKASPFYLFDSIAQKWPSHRSIWSREGCYTIQETYQRACQYGNYFLEKGVRPGDMVAFYLQNSPDFMMAWLGLWAIGCAPAMINFNLSGDALLHCLKVSGSRFVLLDDSQVLSERLFKLESTLQQDLGMEILHLNQSLKAEIGQNSATRPADELREHVEGNFPAAIFYTSGTTGMPKGATFSTTRMLLSCLIHNKISVQNPGPGGDVWFNCMPLYHGTGAFASVSAVVNGYTLAIGKGFSVRNFWLDVRDSETTWFTYVGETARYLLAAPPSPLDKAHRVRGMFGNGLRPDVWKRFQERFNVPEVLEFFNSSEGMLSLLNHSRGDFRATSVGHFGLPFRLLTRNIIFPVEVDHETNEVVRDPKTGFVKRKSWDEGGEIIVRVASESDFPGYWNNAKSTKKSFVYNCEKKGDIFFRSGDALRRCPDGRWYFIDRLGDTFRWKSENVSTAEVAAVIGEYPDVLEANVYGVELPHHEGRAGCAAISVSPSAQDGFDWAGLAKYASERLPRYAVPVFVRVLSGDVGDLAMHNNKQDKRALRTEGIAPDQLGTKVTGGQHDRILFLSPNASGYVPFDKAHWNKIVAGSARL